MSRSGALGAGRAATGGEREARDRQVGRIILIEGAANLIVLALKVVVGLATHSLAVLGDALHSLTDLANNGVAWLVLRSSSAPPDSDHPYGHRKFETVAVFVLASLLTVLAFELMRNALTGEGREARHEGWGLAVMGGVLCVNVAIASWEARWAKRLDSPILRADATHTFSDVLVTLVVIGGWQLAARGIPFADRACALGVGLFILYLAYGLFRRALPVLVDAAALDPELVARVVERVPGVLAAGKIRSRSDGTRTSVDLVVRVHAELPTDEAHAIADRVEQALREQCEADDVSVHVEPEPRD